MDQPLSTSPAPKYNREKKEILKFPTEKTLRNALKGNWKENKLRFLFYLFFQF